MTATQCECMDGPNHVDPTCLYCGGTGVWVSDERLAELVERYTYLVEDSDGISRRDFKASDRQHVAIFKALQTARADEARRVKESIAEDPYEESRTEGANFVLDRLAKALELDRWTAHDGTETWDGDVAATLWGILHDAGVIDPETNDRATSADWQDISTAPISGPAFLVWCPVRHNTYLVIRHNGGLEHFGPGGDPLREKATLWCAIPASPGERS